MSKPKPPISPLRRARFEAQLTRRQLGELAGVSANHIALLEKGQYRPRVETAGRLARALGTTIEKLWPEALEAPEDPPILNREPVKSNG